MKKKILLVLLVVLMVGILAFSVFACNKDDDKKKPDKTPIEEPDDEEEATPFADMLNEVIAAVDNTVKGVGDINEAANVSATIKLAVQIPGEGTAEPTAVDVPI